MQKVKVELYMLVAVVIPELFTVFLESLQKKLPVAYGGKITTAELVNRIYAFCAVFTGQTLYPYQERFSKRVIRSVLENDGEEITALFARQSGKTETVAYTVSGLMVILPRLATMPMFANDIRLQMFKNGFMVGIFAPAKRQAQITYNRMRARLSCPSAQAVLTDPEFNYVFTTSNGQTCALSNGSFVTAISASDQSNIEGESFMLIICEECQDISNFKIEKSIHPMGAAYNATIIKIGTATTFKGNFYEAIQRNKKADAERKAHIYNHFEYDYTVAIKYNPRYARYIEKEKIRLGENSDEFRMSYKLEWIIERGMFIDIGLFEQTNGDPLLSRVSSDMIKTHVAGIDIGGGGDDTVITECEVDWDIPVITESRIDEETGEELAYECYDSYLKDWYVIRNMPNHEEQFPLIVDYLNRFNNARIVVDATKEASVAHRLSAVMKCEVIPYVFSSKSKSELYKTFDREIKAGRVHFPMSPETIATREYQSYMEQMAELQKGYRGALMVVSHPDERGAHDDYPDSHALAVWGCTTKGSKTIPETQTNVFSAKTKVGLSNIRRTHQLTAKRRR